MNRKAVHMTVAAAMLISTMGITINMHFCHEQLIDLALYSPAESCCEGPVEVPCGHQEGISQPGHCEDVAIVVDALKDFLGSTLATNLESNQSPDVLHRMELRDKHSATFQDLKPMVPDDSLPPPYQEVDLALIQSFLI